jgi:hypothetical protein
VLNATQMLEFVRSEAKRQYEECSGEKFDNMDIDARQDLILEQYKWQIEARGWKVINTTFEKIVRELLDIPTLETRNSDELDFYNISVWQLKAVLYKVFEAGKNSK